MFYTLWLIALAAGATFVIAVFLTMLYLIGARLVKHVRG